ncbi:MAG: hypothetical protein KAT70_02205 [Thermoplasmata archaeon]|nr:hypothetical protein [Thermoplasmata archaeon]
MIELNIQLGMTGEYRMRVEEKHCAQRKYIRDDVWVLSTPDMIRAMEFSCILAVLDHLPEGRRTVGTVVNVKHLRATPLGEEIVARGELVKVDGRKLWFTVEAEDKDGPIGRGEHGRYVIDVDEFVAGL